MSLDVWFPFHDAQVQDYSGNGNDASPSGGITTGVAGRSGITATSLDGTDDTVPYGNTHSNFSEVTFSFWSRHPSFTDGQHIWHPKSSNDIRVRETSTGIDWLISDNGGTNHTVSASGTVNQWIHWAGVFDGSEMILYKNGSFTASTAVSSVGSQTGTDTIGSNSSGTANWEGVICDFRVYSRALTQQEIQTLYEWGSIDVANDAVDGVARYALDGDATDSFGSNDGTVNGATFVNDAIRGQAASFDGTDDYISITDDTVFTSAPFTVSAWAKFNATGSTETVFSHIQSNPSEGWELTKNSSDEVFLFIGDSDTKNSASGGSITSDEWYFLTGVYDNGNISVYLNGNLVGEASGPFSADVGGTDTGDVRIGYSTSFSSNITNGILDDVRFYGRALSQSEIHELYQWGTFGRDLRNDLVTK